MVRLKFLLFALIVLGLWLGHLFLVSPALTARVTEEAAAHARSAGEGIRATIAERRLEAAELALSVTGSPRLRNVASAAAADRANQLAALIKELAGESARATALIGAGNDAGGNFLKLDGTKVEGADASMLAAAGSDHVVDIGGVAYAFVTFPVAVGSDGKPTTIGAVGLPLADEGKLVASAKKSGLHSVALVRGTAVIAKGGADPEAAVKAAGALGPGKTEVVERGAASSLMGLPLPMFSDRSGDGAPLMVASRDAIEGSPFEVVAVADVRPYSEGVAAYQKTALPAAVALLLLSLFWMVWIGRGVGRAAVGSGREAPSLAEAGAPATGPGIKQRRATGEQPIQDRPTGEMPAAGSQDEGYSNGGGPRMEDLPAQSEQHTSGDAFPFGQNQGDLAGPVSTDPGSGFPFGDAPQTVPGTQGSAAAASAFAFESEQTRAYPTEAQTFSTDPNEAAAPADNPDATRVAMIPQELLDQSSRPSRGDLPAMKPSLAAKPPSISMPAVAPQQRGAAAAAGSEEAHFQDVYKEFVATKERCGEGADGLTFDKFVQKLRKNKEQLVAKYNCKTVRFQVYVKDGKAALKATPVKE